MVVECNGDLMGTSKVYGFPSNSNRVISGSEIERIIKRIRGVESLGILEVPEIPEKFERLTSEVVDEVVRKIIDGGLRDKFLDSFIANNGLYSGFNFGQDIDLLSGDEYRLGDRSIFVSFKQNIGRTDNPDVFSYVGGLVHETTRDVPFARFNQSIRFYEK